MSLSTKRKTRDRILYNQARREFRQLPRYDLQSPQQVATIVWSQHGKMNRRMGERECTGCELRKGCNPSMWKRQQKCCPDCIHGQTWLCWNPQKHQWGAPGSRKWGCDYRKIRGRDRRPRWTQYNITINERLFDHAYRLNCRSSTCHRHARVDVTHCHAAASRQRHWLGHEWSLHARLSPGGHAPMSIHPRFRAREFPGQQSAKTIDREMVIVECHSGHLAGYLDLLEESYCVMVDPLQVTSFDLSQGKKLELRPLNPPATSVQIHGSFTVFRWHSLPMTFQGYLIGAYRDVLSRRTVDETSRKPTT